jgi:hypothetical protein
MFILSIKGILALFDFLDKRKNERNILYILFSLNKSILML